MLSLFGFLTTHEYDMYYILFFLWSLLINLTMEYYTKHTIHFIKTNIFNSLDNYDKKKYIRRSYFFGFVQLFLTFFNIILSNILYNHMDNIDNNIDTNIINNQYLFFSDILLFIICYFNTKNTINIIHLFYDNIYFDIYNL
jgi:hypothetical protein